MSVTHKPKAGATLTGTEYEASDAHTVSLTAADVGADAAGAAAAAQAASQPLDSDLTAIAALTTTSFGLSHLTEANAAAGRTLLGLGTAALSATTDFDASGAAAAAQAAAATDATTKANAAQAASWPATSAFDATAPAAIGTAAAGAAATAAHRDHVHPSGAGTPSTQAFGDAAATGTGPAASMTDHKHAMPANPVAYAAPSLTLGTANSAGAAASAVRTDATILAFDATVPAAIGTAAVGAATVAARRDHVHPTGAGTPSTQTFGDAAAVGSGPAGTMTDHKHAWPDVATALSALGAMTHGQVLARTCGS